METGKGHSAEHYRKDDSEIFVKEKQFDFCSPPRQDGKTEGQTVVIKDFLQQLTETKYTWEELQVRPLPEGVDPTKMDNYLKESEFEKGLGMSQADFYALPQWKQTKVKREKGLF